MVNPECKLLLLKRAIAKLGATREGVLRSHIVSQGGRMRDSVVFSIIAGEWPRSGRL
jgi:RimJ/RimL family protein N-acetyltransferase